MSSLPAPERRRVATRALLGCLAVIVLTAAVTAAAVFLEVDKVVHYLRQNQAVTVSPSVLAPTSPGAPQTLLLVGDDRRPPPRGRPNGLVVPHSNEMLLVRLDPSKPTISMLSIPRDLKVTILPHNAPPTVKRINVAYTIGGISLMTETIKRVLGVTVNHVVVITFPNFRRAVDEMGCVYTTVDRRYFHANAPGGQQYFEINLQPGYQRLCGRKALEFVAYRHGDTALIRDARDQRFLLDVKNQYGPTLFDNRDKFERIFGKAVLTDSALHRSSGVLDLLQLLIGSSGRPVRQVHFNANLGPIFVTASQQQIHDSVAAWLRGTGALPKRKLAAVVRSASRRRRRGRARLALVTTPAPDLRAAKAAARHLPFALEYPRVLNKYGHHADSLRVYALRDAQGRVHEAYVAVIDRGALGEFYDVQGTGWQDPPLLRRPDQTARIGTRTYGLFYEGDHLKTVAWREGQAVYWINNTLTDTVPPREMLAIAEQTTPVNSRARSRRNPSAAVRNFVLPPRHLATSSSDVVNTLGAAGGFLALLGVAAMARLVYRRVQEINELRNRCEQIDRTRG
jgi:LCP family protein required for cell wall assembly